VGVRSLWFVLVLLTAAPGNSGAAVRFVVPADPGDALRVVGLAGDISLGDGLLQVFVASKEPVPAMLGELALVEGVLEFRPRFIWTPGLLHRAVLVVSGDTLEMEFSLPLPQVELPSTGRVVRIYPTPESLPGNLLRFYVYFSEPMQGGDVYRSIRLVKANGEVVEQAFVETVPELWDPDMGRVTLICHPGRVKQGLEMGEREGPVLVPGETYRLVVDGSMETARGLPLVEGIEVSIAAGEDDRVSPDPAEWILSPPQARTLDPLVIKLDEPLDHALLPRYLSVHDAQGVVEGSLSVTGSEDRCLFVPAEPWVAGAYRLEIHPDLEDLAGNRVDMLFDRASTPSAEERTARIREFQISYP
jgi:hypothetical protein